MKNHATVFSGEGAVITTRRFAIVREPQITTETPMAETSNNPLQDYLLEVIAQDGLSYPAIEREAKKKGWSIGRSTVSQIATGETTNPGIFTLVALAHGINRPVEVLILKAIGPYMQDTAAFQKSEVSSLWEMSKQLPTAEQRFVRHVLQMLENEIKRMLSGK